MKKKKKSKIIRTVRKLGERERVETFFFREGARAFDGGERVCEYRWK